jgi:hypothetical protein
VAYKPKRGRYSAYKAGGYQEAQLRKFIDDILGGGGDFVKFEGPELRLARPKEDL